MADADKIIIFSDGACLGNPGPGAAASIVADAERVLELGSRDRSTTNNRMEILSVSQALRSLDGFVGREIQIFCDSQYVLNGVQKWVKGWRRNGWKTSEGEEVKNRDLWDELHSLVENLEKKFSLIWKYVPGHSGIPGNERCDEIATTLASGQEMFLYDGIRSEYSVDLTDLKVRVSPKSSAKPVKTTASTYYVSLVGGTIYRDKTWKECEARVKGVRAAKYKKVNSIEDEREILKVWGVKSS